MLTAIPAVSAMTWDWVIESDTIDGVDVERRHLYDTRAITDEIFAQAVTSGEIPKNAIVLSAVIHQLSNIKPLTELPDLQNLHLGQGMMPTEDGGWITITPQISDITPLSELTDLRSLSLGATQVSDISSLSSLTSLESLSLVGNQISDLAPLRELTNLRTLVLSESVSDFTPLHGLANLDLRCPC